MSLLRSSCQCSLPVRQNRESPGRRTYGHVRGGVDLDFLNWNWNNKTSPTGWKVPFPGQVPVCRNGGGMLDSSSVHLPLLRFLIADVMWPAASHSCHLDLTIMTDCTLKLCGFSLVELLLPEWCNTGAGREAKALTLQETPCASRLGHRSSTHKSSSDCDSYAEPQMLLRWSSLEKTGTDVSFYLSTFPSPSMGKGRQAVPAGDKRPWKIHFSVCES